MHTHIYIYTHTHIYIYIYIDVSLSKLQEIMKDRDLCSPMNWHAAVHRVAQSDTT